ncbi:MFS transporter [Limnohabitans sp.]|uniref:MFS transporter n=1 Tax=Limnohabitans sp. TaxID=1907725 RepID=UPI00286F74A9|nr:MFS transporter [Limnohabitans sp.]
MTASLPPVRSSDALSRFQLFPFAALSASYFAHIGFFNPYLPLWLKDLGFSIAIIGLLTAVQAATRVLAPYGWGWLSDHTGERVKLLRYCAGAALLCSAGLLVHGGVAWMAFVLLLMFIHTSAMMPMSEAALAHLVSTAQGFDARRYGRVRLWGSLGFLVMVFVAGAWFELQGMQSFPAWAVGSLVLLNLSVWWLPNRKETVHHGEVRPSVMPVLRQRKVQWFFATVFFHVLSHIGIYVFFSLYLDELGYSKIMIGVLWAVSVAAEIVWFFTQSRWLPKFSLSMWMFICAAAMVVRMALTTWAAPWLWALVLAQLLHALTFATQHTACIALLSHHFPGCLRSRGQALYASIGYGVPGVLGALGGGALSDALGLSAVYACSIVTAVLACACAWQCVHHTAQRLVAETQK